MSRFARVVGGVVSEVFSPPSGVAITDCFSPALPGSWVDCTAVAGVAANWTYTDGIFSAPTAPPTVPAPMLSASLIGPRAFLGRFTAAELSAIAAADPWWGTIFNAGVLQNGGMVDVTDAELIADLNAAATAGTITSARVTQILNLSVSSPS